MRHDPASAAPPIQIWRHHGSRSLKMYGMSVVPEARLRRDAVTDLMDRAVGTPLVRETMARGAPAFDAAVPILSQLLKAEMAEREVRSIAYHMKSARFPAYKDLSGFDFGTSEINEPLVRQLHRCEFLDGAQNVVLIGGPRTGKTHVATALGIQVWVAWLLILFALILYLGLGIVFGHRYPAVPVFGVAPCPTTIFTVGILL